MEQSLHKVGIRLIFIFTVALFFLFIVFDTYTWGKYVLLLLSACILLIGGLLNKGNITFITGPYVTLNLTFIFYVLFSAVWAISVSDTVIIARTLFRVFICAYVLFITTLSIPELDEITLLKAVMWAGYLVSIYSLFFYGIDAMIAAGSDEHLRVENDFANVNTVGMACALSCVLQINLRNLCSKERFFPSAFFMIPCIIVVAATQSRKALVFLIVGILGAVIVRTQNSKDDIVTKAVKCLILILILMFLLYQLFQLEIFAAVRERMEGLLNAAFGKSNVDGSTQMRNNLKALGLEWFLKYPLGGVGIANPHILADQYLSFNAYLHDNFVELLCGGGIIGFGLYYSMYAYLFCQLWKLRKVDKQKVTFFTIWLALMLAMDYGMVSYYGKGQNYYLMIHFLNVYHLQGRSK